MPRSLDLNRLKQFETAPEVQDRPPVQAMTYPERWPSREPAQDGQVSIKAPLEVIERFRKLCKDDRRTYADMLSILMNEYDRRE